MSKKKCDSLCFSLSLEHTFRHGSTPFWSTKKLVLTRSYGACLSNWLKRFGEEPNRLFRLTLLSTILFDWSPLLDFIFFAHPCRTPILIREQFEFSLDVGAGVLPTFGRSGDEAERMSVSMVDSNGARCSTELKRCCWNGSAFPRSSRNWSGFPPRLGNIWTKDIRWSSKDDRLVGEWNSCFSWWIFRWPGCWDCSIIPLTAVTDDDIAEEFARVEPVFVGIDVRMSSITGYTTRILRSNTILEYYTRVAVQKQYLFTPNFYKKSRQEY